MNPVNHSLQNELRITTRSLEETRALGHALGAYIESGIAIALTGDLGSGKTAFVQGLARGLDVPERFYITSPTYTLINEYSGRLRLFHIDLYRIGDIDEPADLGFEEIFDGSAVVAVEWAGILPEEFLSECLSLELIIIDDVSRKIRITAKGAAAEKLREKLAGEKI